MRSRYAGNLAGVGLSGAVVLVAWLCGPQRAHAFPTLHPSNADGTSYGLPVSVGSTCTNCHVGTDGGTSCGSTTADTPCLNPFGYDYRRFGSWASISGLDSDGDGITNANDDAGDEGGPGFPAGADEVGCDMLACALAHAGSYNCPDANNYVRCDATKRSWFISSDTKYYFTFAFSCQSNGHWGYSPSVLMTDADWGDRCLNTDECGGFGNTMRCRQNFAANSCTNQNPGYDCSCGTGFTLVNDERIRYMLYYSREYNSSL